jgi:signal-transduction protein with cAMP-binding, CBS, and nucleotidyltransferase domain
MGETIDAGLTGVEWTAHANQWRETVESLVVTDEGDVVGLVHLDDIVEVFRHEGRDSDSSWSNRDSSSH